MKKYIHYGHKIFDPVAFQKVTNRPLMSKPNGGLWASNIKAKYGWSDWCKDEKFRDCNKDNSFVFTLKDDAKVLEINTVKDLDGLITNEEEMRFSSWILLDFEKLSIEYDAIEVNISNDSELYWQLYGWDCDSLLIMNPNIIVVDK